jgi:hypothetical protein
MIGCNNFDCNISTGICGSKTFGSGKLDDCGYWDIPCDLCARMWEKDYPRDYPCWPFSSTRIEENNST